MNKVVILLSTLHYDASIDEYTGNQQKLEIVTFYNQTKYGSFDQLCSLYDVQGILIVGHYFFNLVNILCVNALNMYTFNNIDKKPKRSEFFRLIRNISITSDEI